MNRSDNSSDLNIQFLIDKLTGDREEKPDTPQIHLSNLIIRNGKVSYDNFSILPKDVPFDSNHINLSELNLNISLANLNPDSLDIAVKELTFTETKSNFSI